MKLPLFILLILVTHSSIGQHKVDRELELFLSKKKIDTLITLTTGCTSCRPSYDDTIKTEDIATLKLIYRDNGRSYFVVFSDTTSPYAKIIKLTSIFDIAVKSLTTLKNKQQYYIEFEQAKFRPPVLKVYPYQTLSIKIGQFRYNHTLVDKQTDVYGVFLVNEDWFKKEIELVEELEKL